MQLTQELVERDLIILVIVAALVHGVYVSGEGVARNRATLDEHGITHVINCVGFLIPDYFAPDLVYKTLWLQDTPNEDITCVLYDCFDFIGAALEGGGRVLVHCSQGVSRSASVVISYLMWRHGGARGHLNPMVCS